jgi:large subunit ribosomal protein L10
METTAPLRAGPKKQESVAELTEKFSRARAAVVTDYRGLTVAELETLRGKLREAGVDYLVVKNTLARKAAAAAGIEDFSPVLVGPVGLAIGYDDPITAARIVHDFFKETKKLPTVAGFVEQRLLNADEMKTLATLPSREVLLGQIAGTLMSPLNSLAAHLNSPMQDLAATLDAYAKSLPAAA